MRPPVFGRFASLVVGASLLLPGGLAACRHRAAAAPAPVAADSLRYPRRLVLALDGVDFRDMQGARERGLFAQFRTPSRMVSTFPSISDIAWHEIFGVQPPPGYQRVFFSNARREMVGDALSTLTPIEFEERADLAFDAKFHHVGAYLISNTIARREIDTDLRTFFTLKGRPTAYIYNVGPDALQHTQGDLEAYLRYLDAQLSALLAEYRTRTGRELEIVMISDHGNNHAVNAKFVPIERTLKAQGFRVADEIRSARDVAFSVDGLTTGFGVFCEPQVAPRVAQALADMEGVELVSRRVDDSTLALTSGTSVGRIDMRGAGDRARYRYTEGDGDPLRYAAILARMREERALDADGFADARTWTTYTATAAFPVAVVRLARGHTAVTLNPAPILVSLAATHRIGMGLASISDRLLSFGGTHGSLSVESSMGMVMTNFQNTHDDVSTTVREQFGGFADLGEPRYENAGGRLTSDWLLGTDRRGAFAGTTVAPAAPTPATALEVWISDDQLKWTGGSGAMYVEFGRIASADDNGGVLASSYLPMHADSSGDDGSSRWRVSTDRHRYVLPLSAVGMPTLLPFETYLFRVSVDRRIQRRGGRARSGTKYITTFTVRTDAQGQLWPY